MGGQAGQQACIVKVRFGIDREMEGRDRDIETKKQRDAETVLTLKILSKAGWPNYNKYFIFLTS